MPGLLILAAKENGINREGKEEATARDLPGWGAEAARARGEALPYLWLVEKRPLAARERGDGSLITARLCCVIINYPWQKITY